MTVQDLITQLQELPPNTRIVVSSYEGGYNDAFAVDSIKSPSIPTKSGGMVATIQEMIAQ